MGKKRGKGKKNAGANAAGANAAKSSSKKAETKAEAPVAKAAEASPVAIASTGDGGEESHDDHIAWADMTADAIEANHADMPPKGDIIGKIQGNAHATDEVRAETCVARRVCVCGAGLC